MDKSLTVGLNQQQQTYKQDMCFHPDMNNEAVAPKLLGVNSLAVEVNRGRGLTPLS